ncbi:MAG: DciA family protein [Candidatus Thiodiazotropha sp.]
MEWASKIVASAASHGKLWQQLSSQRALHEQLKQLLPTPLDSQLKATVLQHGRLTLFVASPVWASRFRYLLPQLQRQLQQRGIRLDKVRTAILPDESKRTARSKKGAQAILGREAGRRMHQLAQTIDDPQLRDAMLRLSRHSKQD